MKKRTMGNARRSKINKAGEKQIIEERRELVLPLWKLRMSVRKIASTLEKNGHVNPRNGKPWSFRVIQDDTEFLCKIWLDKVSATVEEHRTRQLAENDALKDICLQKGDIRGYMQCLEFEAKLLGTIAPQKLEHSGPGGTKPVFTFKIDRAGQNDPTG